MTRFFLLVVGVVILVSFVTAGAQERKGTQSSGGSNVQKVDIAELQQTINNLQKSVDRMSQDLDRNVTTVKGIYAASIESYDRAFGRITWIITLATGIVALVVGILTFFGFREVHAIQKIREKFEDSLEGIESNRSRLEREVGELNKNMQAEYLVFSALEAARSRKAYKLALAKVAEAIGLQPTNQATVAWAYLVKGWILRRLSRLDEALGATNAGLDLEPENSTLLYNSACYSALLGNVNDSITALKKCLQVEPSFKDLAKKDTDFDGIRSDPMVQDLLKD